ncbi:MAG TPA: biotin--[acetyl-CoA-carboxylase] ligase [Pyrinomonadaceae bacterium]|nr:biotin--[acetyl-CoA-carboxylase] ligase [Pyrinomonadaceae bacterium]
MSEVASQILRFDSLPSTNLEAAQRAIEGAAEGLCVVASEQTAGRGRLQRQWISPKGSGLYFSIVLRPRIHQSSWPLITLAAALAVHDALLEAYSLKTDIKWPNDILSNNRKLCGILAETVDTTEGRALVLGIGINLTSSAFPPEVHEIATSVQLETGKVPNLEIILRNVMIALLRRYEMLQSVRGGEEVLREWSVRSSYASGKRIRVANGQEVLEGTTRGLESDGALRVETDEGEIRIVRAGDVTELRTLCSKHLRNY